MSHAIAPLLQTGLVHLRAYALADFDAFAGLLTSERAHYIDGPVSREAAWDLFAAGAGRWQLVGYGAWTIECNETGAAAGFVSLNHPIGDTERELGYGLYDGFEGRGLATIAAGLARDFAYDMLGWDDMVSCISYDNHSSIRLAERLGAKFDREIIDRHGDRTFVYRHVKTDE